MSTIRFVLAAAATAAAALAQSPQLRMDPAVAIGLGGAVATYDVAVSTGVPYGVFVDLGGGPVDLLGERLFLDMSVNLVPLALGVPSVSGLVVGNYSLPLFPGLSGLVLYGQAIALDANAPNGLFRSGNGASTSFHAGGGALVAAFEPATVVNYTGNFAADLPGRVRGGAVTRRTHRTVDPSGLFFPQPIQTPLVPSGCREQIVYRPQDLGAVGQPELVTGIRWLAFPGIPVQTDIHSSFELRVGHTPVHPNYAVDPFSALPVAPSSGLNLNFAANAIAAAPPQVLYQGSYVVNPLDQLPGGYMPFPMFASFAYDGVSSLLLEFRVGPGTANGSNGGVVRLMVQSSPDPFGRVFASGTPANPVVPGQVAVATQGDNTMHDLELEFTRVETFCQSPWLDSGVAAPDYRAPIVAASLPAGTGVQLQFRGAQNAAGANPTDWAASPDGADGQRWLQFRLVFVANAITGERPVVDTLVVPF